MNRPLPRLSRAAQHPDARPPAPPRIVHLGAGAFHRTHQAWFTAHAPDAAEWGIAAFTGRSTSVVDQLAPQDGLFTLIERGPQGDRFEVVDSIVEVRPATDRAGLIGLLSAPATAVATLTITEAGYRLRSDGALDIDDRDVEHDITALRTGDLRVVRTPLASLLAGLVARRGVGGGPLAIVPCDNLPDNGGIVRRAMAELADLSGAATALEGVSFVSTSVDRITPHTTPADIQAVSDATGFRDEACVVAEPFADWTMRGDFPAGRPDWAGAGARYVDDIAWYERRKLLLLNGGHLVLAFEGLRRGHRTVAEAMNDNECRAALDAFWDEGERTVGAGTETRDYRAALAQRFANPRIEHLLRQIAVDTVTKTRLRILPVVQAERGEGRSATAALAVLRTWRTLLDSGSVTEDPQEVRALLEVVAEATTSAATIRSTP
jgi:fructuronate reductase